MVIGSLSILLAVAAGAQAAPLSGAALWEQYRKSPDTHPNLPNCSYAGYRYGETPIPRLDGPVFNVRELGAAGDGVADDTKAFSRAVAYAGKAGGVVYAPAGVYNVSRVLLGKSGIVLRGDGPERTILSFERPLSELEGAQAHSGGESEYSWSGGLIHVGPKADFNGGKLKRGEWYGWSKGGAILAKVVKPAKRGDSTLTVKAAGTLKPGQRIFVTWRNPPDHSLLKHMAGSRALAKYPWKKATLLTDSARVLWPAEIESVLGRTITLRQPLRLDVLPKWDVEILANARFVEEVGVEDLGLRFSSGQPARHHFEKGFNGIFFHRALNSWARNVEIENADNGVIIDGAKNVTIEGLRLTGSRLFHHGTFAKSAHDCLLTDFLIEAPMFHGINADLWGSGNVWRRGVMKHGIFDMHHGLSFDLIRTDIEIHNDGSAGGGDSAGPIQGARVAHWNIRATGSPSVIYQPDVMPMGALVGVQGVPLDRSPYKRNYAEGDKGCVVADDGVEPEPRDLYEAERALRLGR
jgi:hypothetical protein